MNLLESKVLKLNKNYYPIEVTTAKNAFEMLYANRAEVVVVENTNYYTYDFNSWAEISELKKELKEYSDINDFIYTTYLTLQIPQVIRSLYYDKKNIFKNKLNRKNIFLRDNNTCQYCGKKFSTQELTIDHVIPKCQGGTNRWDNLVCCCVKCNRSKGGRTPEQANMHLIRKPIKPLFSPTVKITIGKQQKYKDWHHFISDQYWNTPLID